MYRSNSVSVVRGGAVPVLLVDKVKAAVHHANDAAAALLGRPAHRLKALSLFDLTLGLQQHHWARAVAAITIGADWTALE